MRRQSAFVCESSRTRLHGEKRYCIVYSAALFLCGTVFFLIPFDKNGLFLLAEGWLLLFAFGLCLLRPAFFGRGVADFVMTLFCCALYALLGYAIGKTADSIRDYAIAISLAFFFSGLSRLIAFAGLIVVVCLPLLPVCGLFEIAAAVLLFYGWPDDDAFVLCWFIGVALILSGFESLTEAAKLHAQ